MFLILTGDPESKNCFILGDFELSKQMNFMDFVGEVCKSK